MQNRDWEKNFQGMTANERIYQFKTGDAFDAAIRSKDKKSAISALLQAKFTPEQADSTVEARLRNPSRYGY